MSDITAGERRAAILLVRLQRGDLNDDTDGLRELYHALGNVLRGRP